VAAVIPYDGKDPLKYLYTTAHQLHRQMGLDVIVVDTGFHLYPPYVKRIRQKTPGVAGARYDGFTYALKAGYDCIINSDSHLIFLDDITKLCRTSTWSSTYHHPHLLGFALPIKIYSSYIAVKNEVLTWCSVVNHRPDHIVMTNEPLYAVRRHVLEDIVHWWARYTTYALDNIGLLFAPEGEIIEAPYIHIGPLDRGKPTRRKPSKEEAERFKKEVWPRVAEKIRSFESSTPPQARVCLPLE